jgi:hypothetical protein
MELWFVTDYLQVKQELIEIYNYPITWNKWITVITSNPKSSSEKEEILTSSILKRHGVF